MKMRVILVLAFATLISAEDDLPQPRVDRQGRLFLVSSSTTTTTLSTNSICYATTALGITTCAGRKKRQLIEDPISHIKSEIELTKPTRVYRQPDDFALDSSADLESGSNRKPKFFLYWMTTTSTSTTTTFTTTQTLSSINCTPNNFIYSLCG
ncbi:uncharacterized protein LOC111712643 [Eurytemora carolleeae]|uniref:uncharacterized protein LOC111712643 n=1 Tax=Eurytemora carolleeae TaxID=1294199 RepID=UPI000C761354|nr:uncharacterized protein LOC111712643 [Eurytemora carolleeae]|eukprot:XP_023343088.1 uncharacterized protein LOC111712643 [Eurytemora affinis]